MRPWRQVTALGIILIGLWTLVLFTGPGKLFGNQRLEPRLGLDLVGGTTLTLIARTPDGKPPSSTSLEQARQIIENRVNGLGVAEPEVVTEGNSNIQVSVAGSGGDVIKQVGQPAQLKFRKALGAVPDSSAGTPSSPSAQTPTSAQTPVTLDQVKAKLGPAWDVATTLKTPDDGTAQAAQLAAFSTLSAREVAVLPPAIQINVPTVSCRQLNDRPAGSIDNPNAQVVACDNQNKYLLDVAKVVGTDVASADFGYQNGGWQVNLTFTSTGQQKWTDLSKEAYADGAKNPVGIVLDNAVVSAPAIQGVITGPAQITGSFTQKQAELLANQLKYGALPLTFEQGEASSISATLGTEQLRAGLIAAAIGMALVVMYALFYYRLLGTVIIGSLIISGLLTFAVLVLLGRQIGLTLTLASIAGFIVSLGVAADSFVIYFERLKDEIRDGRSPRSAVDRAWLRARRTIISANVVTIGAAVVLYVVSIGDVKGFAFALGLATTLDLLVVFLFRHPMMTLLAGSSAFLSPQVSGLGRVVRTAETSDGLAARLYRGEAGLNIIGRRKLWYTISAVLAAVAIISFAVRGFQLGIEFQGGNSFQIPASSAPNLDAASKAVAGAGARVISAQRVGGTNSTYLIRTAPLTADQTTVVQDKVAANLKIDPAQVSGDRVSAAWGSQITNSALLGLLVFLGLVIAYLVLRFEWRMAVAAISALLFDLLLVAGIYSLVGFEVSPSTVIGMLTILGFALYDVVVVFDKVHENTARVTASTRRTYAEAANLAVNQTLMRSINTFVIALLPVAGMLFIGVGLLGAGTLKDLALVLFVGMATAVFSSIFLATPITVDLKYRDRRIRAHDKRVRSRRVATA
jgi:preprotein translocase subunit SecD